MAIFVILLKKAFLLYYHHRIHSKKIVQNTTTRALKLKTLHGKMSTGFDDNISFRIQNYLCTSLCKWGERVILLYLGIVY